MGPTNLPSHLPGAQLTRGDRHLAWLFPVVTTLHNLEEALFLPRWSQQPGALHVPVGTIEFGVAVLLLTVAAWAVTALAVTRGGRWSRLCSGYQGAMLLNVVAPHLVMAMRAGGYVPGIVTALALNLPVNAWLLAREVRARRATARVVAGWSLGVGVVLVAVIPALFALGRLIERMASPL